MHFDCFGLDWVGFWLVAVALDDDLKSHHGGDRWGIYTSLSFALLPHLHLFSQGVLNEKKKVSV
jgi:hypothetical protein